jgi:hypothetical protein
VAFGARKAYEVHDPRDKKYIEAMIPAGLYDRRPRRMTHDWVPYVLFNTYTLTRLPTGERVLFVMTKMRGKKMCFIIMKHQTYLVSLCINSIDMFIGSVMEGYIEIDKKTGRYNLQISDIFLSAGVQTDAIPYGLRHMMLLLFITTTLQPRESDAVMLSVPDCIDSDRFTELYTNKIPMMLHPDNDFEHQRKNGTYLHYTPALNHC